MKIKYLSESGYNELFDGISNNLPNYQTSKDSNWIISIFGERSFCKESRIDTNLPELNVNVDNGDYVNTIAIHSAFKDKITPKQASNPYLWAYLTHCHYWEYSVSRWAKSDMSVETVKQRFFCNTEEGNRIGLLRNAISRLWWFGYLTYQDGAKSNPYALTQLMLSNSDLCQSIIERNFSMNRNITSGILLAIKEINDDPSLPDVGAVNNGDHYEWRPLCKFINRYGAVTLLDTLTQDDIKELAYTFLMDYRKKWGIK